MLQIVKESPLIPNIKNDSGSPRFVSRRVSVYFISIMTGLLFKTHKSDISHFVI